MNMNIPIEYRRMEEGDAKHASSFIEEVFKQFVAPEFSQEGIEEFMRYIQPDALLNHLSSNHFGILASAGPKIIGVIVVRDYKHVALFFVASHYQRKGIGKKLFSMAMEHCCRQDIRNTQITVNASPNSIDAYRNLKFEPSDIEQSVNGIRFVPMTLHL